MKERSDHRDVDRMRELLARTPPEGPGVAGRADAVVERARRARTRKRRGAVGAGVVAVIAAAVIVTPHFLETSPTTNEATDPTNGTGTSVQHPTSRPDPWTTNPCPVNPIDISAADKVPDLPTGAETVRLCPAVLPHVQGSASKQDVVSTWAAPPEAVVKDPDGFVAAVATAPDWNPGECAAVDWVTDPYAIVVTYRDQTRVLGAGAPICTSVSVADRAIGSADVLSAYVAALKAQGSSVAQVQPADPTCGTDGEQTLSTFDVDQIAGEPTAGVVCYNPGPAGDRVFAEDSGALTPEQLATLVSDIEMNTRPSSGMHCMAEVEPNRVLRLVDARGNVTAWVADRCSGEFESPFGAWKPTAVSEQILTDALGGAA